MFDEDDLLPLSALQHLLFCPRRAALVHIEGLWAENVATREGGHLHKKAHDPGFESRGNIRICRSVPLRSLRLGLSGKADVIEFHRVEDATDTIASKPPWEPASPDGNLEHCGDSVGGASMPRGSDSSCGPPFQAGCLLPGVRGLWQPFPVEYKRGRLREEEGYEIQLCAQALCLEEMLGCVVAAGAIFYGKTNRRLKIAFDKTLRDATELAVERLHHLIAQGVTPRATYEPKCEGCSMLDLCLPGGMGPRRSANRYLSQLFESPSGEV